MATLRNIERPRLEPQRFALLFLFGAVVITVLDGFHTISGTTAYVGPHQASRLTWWTPLLMGAGTTVSASIFVGMYRALGAPRRPPPWSVLASAFWCFGAFYFFSGFYHGPNTTKLAVLGVAGIAAFWWLDRTWQGAVCALSMMVIGPTFEIMLVRAGTFVHLQPDVLGIPMWLPALYLCAAPVVGHGARRLLSPGQATMEPADAEPTSSPLPSRS